MDIKLARTAGFCMGVRRAVDAVLDVAQHGQGRRIYTYGPLIHNPQTIELLENRGVHAVASIDDIPNRDQAVLVLRAHGIPPAERRKIKESGIRIIDATCPKVGYVQAIIKKHAALGYTVVIVGDREHPEVDGLMGYARDRGIVISSLDESRQIPSLDKVCIVAQTTQDLDAYQAIVSEIQSRCPDAVVFNTICSSTERRQAEVIALACEMDALFVVGGKNSANTCRLADLARKQNTPTFHIENADEMTGMDLSSYRRIGVSAGASTPNWIIDRVMDRLAEAHGGKMRRIRFLLNAWVWMIKTDIYSALGAACLALACMAIQGIVPSLLLVAAASLFVYAMHVINRVVSRKPLAYIGSFREATYARHERLYRWTAILSLALALGLAFFSGFWAGLFMALTSSAGLIYNMKIMPPSFRFQSLRDIPGSKNLFMAVAWGAVVAVLPAIASHYPVNPAGVIAFIFVFGLVFVRSALSDILEIQSDKLLGRETIPVVFGREKTQRLLKGMLVVLLFILIFSYPAGVASSVTFFLTGSLLYLWICFGLCDRRSGLSGALVEGLLETSYIIAGFGVLAWWFWGLAGL